MAKKVKETDEVSENIGNEETAESEKAVEVTEEMVRYVRENVKTMTYGEIGKEIGLADKQVSGVLQNLKRKLRSKVGYGSYEKKTYENKSGKQVTKPDFTKPKTDQARKLETWISENLSRPVTASSMSDALSSEVDHVLAKIK